MALLNFKKLIIMSENKQIINEPERKQVLPDKKEPKPGQKLLTD